MNSGKYNLTGKTCLITGAAGLLGYQHASALLETGSRIILTDVFMSNLILCESKLREEFSSADIKILTMDVTNINDIKEVQKNLDAQKIRVDILINNAAIDPKVNINGDIQGSTRLEHFSLNSWEQQLKVGLTGAFLCAQVFGSAMASDCRGGNIVNIASDLSLISPDQRLYRDSDLGEGEQPVKPVTYSVIKAGLIGLTRYLATYWANEGVRSNALSPGGVLVNQSPEFISRINNLIPMGRMANIDEYRSAIQFLCSDASSYMNGHNLVMDGGRSVW
jgi:NAD(P)-dependent dehydrogenase (short-subunit alcohol dehydrogenase family)